MDADVSTAAPAQPTPDPATATPSTTAADTAIASNDVAGYRAARRAERAAERPTAQTSGTESEPFDPTPAPTPAPAPAATPAAAATAEQRATSKRQQQLNDLHRRIAEQDTELARLKAPAAPAGTPATTRPAAGAALDLSKPALDEAAFYAADPAASTADYIRYLTRYDREVDRRQTEMHTARTAAEQATHTRATKFHEQILAISPDPLVFLNRLDPELVALETRATAQAQGKPPSAANDLAEELLDSDVAPQVLEHLTAHPEDKAKLLACTSRRELVKAFTRIEGQFTASAARAGTPLKTTTDAPAPPVTLGSRSAHPGDAADAAVARGDVAGFRAARLAQRAAAQR